MADAITVRVTHRYNLPAERVFDAWLTPGLAGRFLFASRTGTVLHCEIDPQEGGEFTLTDRRPTADGDDSFFDAQHRGTYIEIDRPSRLVFDFGVEPYTDDPTRVTVDIVTLGTNLCEVVLSHNLGEGESAQVYEERTRQGWTSMLAQLDKVLNTRSWGGLKG